MVKPQLGHGDFRTAITLVELIVIVSVISVLMALTLPAVLGAREASRALQCQNNLKQIGIGLHNHESTFNRLPSNGWGYNWIGEPERGSGIGQPGGWIYSSLPFLEQKPVHDIPLGILGAERFYAMADMLATPALLFRCPASSKDALTLNFIYGGYNNSLAPKLIFESDYAGNGGSKPVESFPGPDSYELARDYNWREPHESNGVFMARFPIRFAQIADGLSNTYLAGEKLMSAETSASSLWGLGDTGGNQSAYTGDCQDIRRTCNQAPARKWRKTNDAFRFGSMHPTTWNALFADGSVQPISYEIDLNVHKRNGSRNDE